MSCLSWIFRVHYTNVLFTQGYTTPGGQAAMATEFCTVGSNICGCPVRNLLHFTLLVPRILRWLLDFQEICGPLHLEHSRLSLHAVRQYIEGVQAAGIFILAFTASCPGLQQSSQLSSRKLKILLDFRLVPKTAKCDYQLRHICPSNRSSVRMELGSHLRDFH